MAGVLDKKTRIIDYIMTREGRAQFGDSSDLRFVYATVSDRGVEYLSKQSVDKLTYKDAGKYFVTGSDVISDSERVYLGFEASSISTDRLNPEYNMIGNVSYPVETQDSSDPFGKSNFNLTENSFQEITAQMSTSFIDKIKALKIIDTFNQIEEEDIKVKSIEFLKDIKYEFTSESFEDYPTVFSRKINLDKEKTLKDDMRFFHKNNFKKLVPVNENGTALFSTPDLDANTNFIFKKYKWKNDFLVTDNRETIIKKSIKSLEKNKKIKKSIFEILNPTENDSWISQIFEINDDSLKFNKLACLDLGEFYFEETGITKQVFLFGKIYKSANDLKPDDTENFPVFKKEIILSKNYSFINIFTMVVE